MVWKLVWPTVFVLARTDPPDLFANSFDDDDNGETNSIALRFQHDKKTQVRQVEQQVAKLFNH